MVPEVEEVVSSPVDARVVRILERAGAELQAGQPLVELDARESALAVDRLAQNLALKPNQQDKTRLELERSLNDLDSQARIKDLQLQAYRSQLARNRALSKEGLISEEVLRQSELAEAQAVVELKKIQAERDNAQRITRTTLDGLDLEMGTLRKEVEEARRQLNLAAPRAARRGVLTWSLSEEGSAIRKGDVIARIADLSSFRVDATLSDVHAKRVSVGLPVTVRVGEETLEGSVFNVLPTIRNGVMTLQIALKEKSSPLLRSNLRVDAFIVTGRRSRALRVHRGPFAAGRRSGRCVRGPRRAGYQDASGIRHRRLRGLRGRARSLRGRRGHRLRHEGLPAPQGDQDQVVAAAAGSLQRVTADTLPAASRQEDRVACSGQAASCGRQLPRNENGRYEHTHDQTREHREGLPHRAHRDGGPQRHQPRGGRGGVRVGDGAVRLRQEHAAERDRPARRADRAAPCTSTGP